MALVDKPGQMSRAVASAKDEAAEECGGGQESFTEGHEEHSAAKPQPQTEGPEPTKRYQLHAEDAEER
jgi:hypothetical protein